MTKPTGLANWPADWQQRQWSPTDGERCQQCNRRNPCWWVNPELWWEVMGSDTGVLCPTCFLGRCDDKGIGRRGAWQLYPPGTLR